MSSKSIAVHVLTPPKSFVYAGLDSSALNGAKTSAQRHLQERVTECIVVGSRKPELRDCLLNSTAGRMVRHAPCMSCRAP